MTQNGPTRVLWLTRHRPTRDQLNSLRRIFGQVEIIQRPVTVNSARDVVRLMRKENCTEVMPVLPLLTMLDLVAEGVRPLVSVMDRRRGKHKYFARLVKVTLESERLGDDADGETVLSTTFA